MTRRYEHEPTQVMKVTREEVVCDLCGLTLQASPPEKLDYWYHHLEHYQIDDIVLVKMKRRIDGGFFDIRWIDWQVDLCPVCFLEKLLPWLKSQGAEPQVSDSKDFTVLLPTMPENFTSGDEQ